MSDFDDLIKDLKQTRDELRLQIHLASKEAKEEWEELEEKMEDFSSKAKKFSRDAELKKTGEGLGEALGKVGHELQLGYRRLRKAMKD
jgi:chromosome segregation ATPase